MRLQGKVAIITGGATGIGEAIAKKFAKEGANVIVAGIGDDPITEVVDEINKSYGRQDHRFKAHQSNLKVAVGFLGNVGDADIAKQCIDKAISEFGKLDILINNAGILPDMKETQEFEDKYFEHILNDNIKSTFYMTKAALPYLRKTKGNIVSAGSEAGLQGIAQCTPYGGSKAFIHGFMKGIAVEQGKYGIRANCVCPGPIDTQMSNADKGAMTTKMEKMVKKASVFGRRGTPEEVANVYLFLASDEASYVTGSLHLVDGGIVISKGNVGDEAESDVKQQPKGELELRHELEGFRN